MISDPVELVNYSVSLPRTLPRIVPNTSEAGRQILFKNGRVANPAVCQRCIILQNVKPIAEGATNTHLSKPTTFSAASNSHGTLAAICARHLSEVSDCKAAPSPSTLYILLCARHWKTEYSRATHSQLVFSNARNRHNKLSLETKRVMSCTMHMLNPFTATVFSTQPLNANFQKFFRHSAWSSAETRGVSSRSINMHTHDGQIRHQRVSDILNDGPVRHQRSMG